MITSHGAPEWSRPPAPGRWRPAVKARSASTSRTCQSRMAPPTRSTTPDAATRSVSTNGMLTKPQTCELGATREVPARAHSGTRMSHRSGAATSAPAAARRASSQVRGEGPCHSSASQ